ncbi:site-specific integrase [Bifidobacterium sp. ESL0790]|nr:site-specific integrase [Bifidobacterium sp. ESL0790]WEV72160.1 site-specific integrase [Bifidobacterium sp. ESL0790]
MILNEFVDAKWRPSCAALRECTMVGYESALRLHILPVFGEMKLDDIDVQGVEAWIAGMPSRGAARKAWSVLRSILRKAVRWGDLERDITLRVQSPKRCNYHPAVLNSHQIRTLLQGFYNHPLEAWLICSVTLGLRTEEALGLEWTDINLRDGHVSIERGLQWVGGHEVIVDPKTNLSRRTVILPRFAVKRLRQIRHGRKGRIIGDLNPNQVARRYRTRCRKNNLPWVPRRNLRHSWATTALAAGVDVAIVSRALGHSDISTTARYYLRPELSVLRDAQKLWEHSIMAS